MVRAPAQYTSVPLADTAKAALRPQPVDPFRHANRLARQLEALQIEPLGHEGAVAHEKEEVGRAEAMRRLRSSDTRLRSGESSDAT